MVLAEGCEDWPHWCARNDIDVVLFYRAGCYCSDVFCMLILFNKVYFGMKSQAFMRAIAVAASCAFIGGCTLPSPSFNSMAAEYQNTVEQYNFNNILLNVVRASDGLPLSFLDIPSIVGTGNFSASVGGTWTNSSLGAGVFSAATSSLSLTVPSTQIGSSFNYTQSSLDNATFQASFNSKIPLTTVNYFAAGNVPGELLLYLMVGSISLVKPDGSVEMYINSPYSNSYDKFQTLLNYLVKYNLTTQVNQFETPLGPKLSQTLAATVMPAYLSAKNAEKMQMKFFPAVGKQEAYYQLMQMNEVITLCFGESSFKDEIRKEFGDSYFCSKPVASSKEKIENPGITADAAPVKGKTSIAFGVRSNRDIYQYLGEIIKIQNSKPNFQVTVDPTGDLPGQQPVLVPLLVVKKNQNLNNPLARVTYRGNTYEIPSSDNGYSPTVINIMAQLLNLNKVNGSIPASPAVLIK